MKKLFLIAAMSVMLGTVGTAFAAGETQTITGEEGTTKITYTKDSSYTIIIPGDFALSTTETKKQVSAEGVILNNGKELNVTISGANCAGGKWYVETTSDQYEYTITRGDARDTVWDDSIILAVEAGNTDTVETDLYFKLTDTVKKAGTYTDTLTFTVSVEDLGEVGPM